MILVSLALVAASLASAQDYSLPPAPVAVSTSTTLLRYSADHLDYEASTSSLHLKGHVVVLDSTRTVTSDELWGNTRTRMFHFKGHVLVVDSTRTIKGDEFWVDTVGRSGRSDGYLYVEDKVGAVASERGGDFDFDSGDGHLYKTAAGHGYWRVHAREAQMSGRKKLDYLGADFTSCDVVPPHYHFHASKLRVRPGKSMVGRNVVFYLGPVPLFYTPFIYKSLSGESKVRVKAQFGYDSRNGAFAKTTLYTTINPFLYDKAYLDYYSKEGVGLGNELEHRKGDSRSVVTGYQIHESSGVERWTAAVNAYETFGSAVSAFQVRVQGQSDADFNNHYARSSTFRVTPELINDAAWIYRKPKYNLRVSYARHDLLQQDLFHYFKNSEDTRVDVNSAQFNVGKLPWLNSVSGFANNNYTLGRTYLQRTAGGSWDATRTIKLSRSLALVPRVDFSETWYDQTDVAIDLAQTRHVYDATIGRYTVGGTLRWYTLLGAWDLGYGYTKRLKADSFTDDAVAADHGVEQNLLSLTDAFRPSRQILLRASSAYDFRVFRDHMVGFRDRVQPIIGEAIYTPRHTFNVTVRNVYGLTSGEQSFIASLLHGDEQKSFYSIGVGYNGGSTGTYSADTEFAVANASGTWRLIAALRSQLGTTGGLGGFSTRQIVLFEKEVSIVKAWHDFNTRAMVRFRPGDVREYTVRVELRFGPPGQPKTTVPVGRRDWESEWFPERTSGLHDRP